MYGGCDGVCDREAKDKESDSTSRSSSSSTEFFDLSEENLHQSDLSSEVTSAEIQYQLEKSIEATSAEILNQSESSTEGASDETATEASKSEQYCHDLASVLIKASKTVETHRGTELPSISNASSQLVRPKTTAVARRTMGSNAAETSSLIEELRQPGTSSQTMPFVVQKPRSSSYHTCPYHKKRKYFIDHFCKDHTCLVCKKCSRKRHHRKCKIDALINVCHDLNVNEEIKRSCYRICPYHKNSNYLVDHFCTDHSCLVCEKCASKMHHAKCKTDSIVIFCRDLNLKEELKQFKSSLLNDFKRTILSMKETLDSHLRIKNIQNERQKILKEAREMFQSPTPYNKCAIEHIAVDLEWALENQLCIISDHMKNIDNILKSFDNTYIEIESAENEYKDNNETLFIAIQTLVVNVNKLVNDFQQLQSNLKLIHLKIHYPTRLNHLLSKSDRISSVKVELCPYQETPVQCYTFPLRESPHMFYNPSVTLLYNRKR